MSEPLQIKRVTVRTNRASLKFDQVYGSDLLMKAGMLEQNGFDCSFHTEGDEVTMTGVRRSEVW